MTSDPARSTATCAACLARSWLLARLAGHLDRARHHIADVLALADDELITAVGGREAEAIRSELSGFSAADARAQGLAAGVRTLCRCAEGYPARLRDLPVAPTVLHLTGAGDLPEIDQPVVAVVGARRAGPYALGVAGDLARGLAAAGVTVVSGLAIGVDSAAHEGALAAGGQTIAVLPAAPERPYPASRRGLHRRILATGLAVSELPVGIGPRRWMFPARNRVIAALADMTIVVAAGERSGSLVTARIAGQLGRRLGAVPGPVTSPLSRGPHELLREGARLVAGPEDVLDALLGVDGASTVPAGSAARTARPAPATAPGLDPELRRLLEAVADGHSAPDAFAAAGLDVARGMAALAALELVGYVRREPGGRYSARV